MRILHVCQTCPPEWSGGSTVFALLLGEHHAEAGLEVEYLCGSSLCDLGPGEVRNDTFDGTRVTRVGCTGLRAGGLVPRDRAPGWRRLNRGVRQLFAEHRVDLIHIHSITELSRPVFRAAHAAGVPIVLTLHEGAWVCPNYFFENNITRELCRSPGFWKCFACRTVEFSRKTSAGQWPRSLLSAAVGVLRVRFLYRRLLERADGVVGCCEYVCRQYRHFGVRNPIVAIRNLIPDGEILFKPETAVATPLRIGVLGAFREHKGGDVLLDALARLSSRYGDFLIDVWGPAPEGIRGERRRTLYDAPLTFHGYYERSSLNLIFSRMDLMIHPSTWDTYSTVILEALASRTPVLAARATGTVEIVTDGENGYLFSRNSPRDLATKLEWLLDHPEDLSRMQQRMRPPESYRTMSDAYAGVYRKVVATTQEETRQ